MDRRSFLTLPLAAAAPASPALILLWMDGGCPHLDTFDLKPGSPFHSIPTSSPGVRICEHLPLTARHAHRFTIVRSVRSSETNHERAAAALLPPGAPVVSSARAAVRLVETGARAVVLSLGERRFDTHADHFRALRDSALPAFDRTFSGLLQDLSDRGLLSTTRVVATGEFGRTPRLNRDGGRDHHSDAWSAVLAGAGVPGGHVIGATDRFGVEVIESPVTPAQLLRWTA